MKVLLIIALGYFSPQLFASNSNELLVQKGIKHAITILDQNVDVLKKSVLNGEVKQSFILLLNVEAHELRLFLDDALLSTAFEQIQKETILPLHKQRLNHIVELLRYSKEHPSIPRIFEAYQSSTRAIWRQDSSQVGLSYAIGKNLEKFQPKAFVELFERFQNLIETQEAIEVPLKIFKMCKQNGFTLLPSLAISEWHDILFRTEPELFLQNSKGEFIYARFIRKIFSNSHYLYQYLKEKDSQELTTDARQFITNYEKEFPDPPKTLKPKEWAKIYEALAAPHPQIIKGIFSLPENTIFHEYYTVMKALHKDHISYCSELISESFQNHPQELMVTLRYILQKQGGFSDSQIKAATPQQFMEWVQEGKLPIVHYAMTRVKVSRTILETLQHYILLGSQRLDEDTLEWADITTERSLAQMEKLWTDLHLPLTEIDSLYLKKGLSAENIARIMITRNLIGRLFGEEYILSLKAFRTHLQMLKRQVRP